MTDNIKNSEIKTDISEKNIAIPETKTQAATKMTIGYVLGQIEKIAAQTEYLNHAIDQLGKMPDDEPAEAYSPGNIAGQAKAKALGDIVESRETTNQQLLKLYEKIYDDLKKQSRISR